MATHTTLGSLFSDIADSIRAKLGTTEPIVADTFPEAIDSIITDPSGECTATDDDILLGKTAYADHQLRTGTIPTKTESDIEVDNGSVTVPSGYFAVPATVLCNRKDFLETVTLSADSWVYNASEDTYTQVVQILATTTNNTMANLAIDNNVLSMLYDTGIKQLYIGNENQVFTAYSVGDKPLMDIQVQCCLCETITES